MNDYLDVAKYLVGILDAAKTSLGVKDVFYGDQSLLPNVPAACVEPEPMSQEFVGVPFRMERRIRENIYVYYSRLGNRAQGRMDGEALSIAVADFLQLAEHRQAGGLVIHSFITTYTPGYRAQGGHVFYATRLTWEGLVRVQLPIGALT
ncbi:MAG TPA: hypothetical protein VM715_04685 [Candidatus Acidoferrum sp.]|jgi:hypothetical protein|nr:hypothetical protein [Candidatus Acidoferrum sp.]